MRKETLADKLARKSFESAAIQKSWQVHTQAFGPILEPAFVGDYQARIHLTAAKGDGEKANELAELVKTEVPEVAEFTCKMVKDILEKEHPHFAYVPLTEGYK